MATVQFPVISFRFFFLFLIFSAAGFAQSDEAATYNTAPLTNPQSVEQLQEFLSASDKPAEEKVYALKQAARFVGPDAVPVIAGYLADARLSQAARLALLQIPGDGARQALEEAAEKSENVTLLPGLLRTIGERQDAASVAVLAGFLSHPSNLVVQAAAEALGKIGSESAADALLNAWKAGGPFATEAGKAERKNVLAAGLFACERAMLRTGGKLQTETIYQTICRTIYEDADVDSRIRAEAMAGLIELAEDEQAKALIWQAFDSQEKEMQSVFNQSMDRLDEKELTKRLLEGFTL